MSSAGGFPDWQRITQWIGAPVVQGAALALGAGSHDDGPFQLASWASAIVAIKPAVGPVVVTLRQAVSGAPGTLELDSTFTVQPGVVLFESVVLQGNAVSLHLQGSVAGTTVDYALIPANTTINAASVSGGSIPTGTILTFAGAAAPAGYVLCDGTHYDGTNAVYTALWNLIGLTYGGTSQADFAVPDLRGRVAVGLGTHASVNARGANDGVAVANRRPHHRHTPHSHAPLGGGTFIAGGAGNGTVGAAAFYMANRFTDATTAAADGGSGVAADSLDAPAFEVVNYMIAL